MRGKTLNKKMKGKPDSQTRAWTLPRHWRVFVWVKPLIKGTIPSDSTG